MNNEIFKLGDHIWIVCSSYLEYDRNRDILYKYRDNALMYMGIWRGIFIGFDIDDNIYVGYDHLRKMGLPDNIMFLL